MNRLGATAVFLAACFSRMDAQPLKLLSIGDSLTEEYRFETPFSAPVTNPTVANTKNWVELLSERRSSDVSFGTYEPSLFNYPDFRNAGYKYNYGVPSFETTNWIEVINSTIADTFSGDAYRTACYFTKTALGRHLQEDGINVVIIFLGGNDLNGDYDRIAEDAVTPALLAQAVENVEDIHAFVRSRNATVPVVICTIPDIGATAKVAGDYPDPAGRAMARQRIADANTAMIAKAAQLGAQVARIDRLTDRIFDEVPFHLNGTVMLYPPDNANPPDRIFCHDGFHPSTVGQALIANEIIEAVNRATGRSIGLFQNREILGPILGLNPDQPYVSWAGSAGAMTANPDGDVAPNLVEFVLDTPPATAGSPFTFGGNGGLSFLPKADRLRFASLRVLESETLANDWQPVPESRVTVASDGTWTVAPDGGTKNFYKLEATTRP